ncbi:hypothetical protein PR202_ga31248 [Eleusine coracana subsp. coracana]|uniref:Uncharacterized protein n=1 Tax=Eleusine coracana subsp. coracana TaxID=191504 RepID=A0AAV5DRZ0_ELECO|nr:hypothetical protein PR202_ga31248 [Eleusine coracana subsp. coracana]
MWKKLVCAHEGVDVVKKSRLQVLKNQFNFFAMNKGEEPQQTHDRLMDIITERRAYGDNIKDEEVNYKLLMALRIWNPTLCTIIEEKDGFESLTTDKRVGLGFLALQPSDSNFQDWWHWASSSVCASIKKDAIIEKLSNQVKELEKKAQIETTRKIVGEPRASHDKRGLGYNKNAPKKRYNKRPNFVPEGKGKQNCHSAFSNGQGRARARAAAGAGELGPAAKRWHGQANALCPQCSASSRRPRGSPVATNGKRRRWPATSGGAGGCTGDVTRRARRAREVGEWQGEHHLGVEIDGVEELGDGNGPERGSRRRGGRNPTAAAPSLVDSGEVAAA